MKRILAVPTSAYIATGYFLAILAGVLSVARKLVTYGADSVTAAIELGAMGAFAAAYLILLALLVVGPLRPHRVFTLRGNAGRRVANFVLAMAGFLLLHVWVLFAVATAGS